MIFIKVKISFNDSFFLSAQESVILKCWKLDNIIILKDKPNLVKKIQVMQILLYFVFSTCKMLTFKEILSHLKKKENGTEGKYRIVWLFTYLPLEIFLME